MYEDSETRTIKEQSVKTNQLIKQTDKQTVTQEESTESLDSQSVSSVSTPFYKKDHLISIAFMTIRCIYDELFYLLCLILGGY